jgi:hypothetical protein
MKLLKTVNLRGIKYPMSESFPHYGDILKKVERVIDSCETLDQMSSAWKFADLFENHCRRINVNDQSRIVMRSTINNLLEDRWESIRLKKLNEQ